MKALVAAPNLASKIELRDVAELVPKADETLVDVRAISLNRGECRMLGTAQDGFRPGWDFAGTVHQVAADGSGPRHGARVVGMVRSGAWAERVAAPTRTLAELPPEVTFAAASTLPVAGLTAYRALAVGGYLQGLRVLVTGATGGVGHFAIQLAHRAGAQVAVVVRNADQGPALRALGAEEIIEGADTRPGRFDLILESVGGSSLAASLAALNPGGRVVLFGNSTGQPTTFDVGAFFRTGSASLYGLYVFDEIERHRSGTKDLGVLAALVGRGALKPQIDLEVTWRQADVAIGQLMDRRIRGKAVLRVE